MRHTQEEVVTETSTRVGGSLIVSMPLFLTIPSTSLGHAPKDPVSASNIKYSLKQFQNQKLEKRSESKRHNTLPRSHCALPTLILGISV